MKQINFDLRYATGFRIQQPQINRKANIILSNLMLILFMILVRTDNLLTQQQIINVEPEAQIKFLTYGDYNIIHYTEVIKVSPDYLEMTNQLNRLDEKISEKRNWCEELKKDSANEKYQNYCRKELNILHDEYDALASKIRKSREDFAAIYAYLLRAPAASPKFERARALISQGKIRETNELINLQEVIEDGEYLLREKKLGLKNQSNIDTSLFVKASELLIKARTASALHQYNQALTAYRKSVEFFEFKDNLWGYAEFLAVHGDFGEAVAIYQKTIRLANRSGDFYFEAALMNRLGMEYYEKKNYENAEVTLLEALNKYHSLSLQKRAACYDLLAMIKNNLGNIYRDRQDFDSAEKAYNNALLIWNNLSMKEQDGYKVFIAAVKVNLGLCYLAQSDTLNAKAAFVIALNLYKELAKDSTDDHLHKLAIVNTDLANLYLFQGNKALAGKTYLEAVALLTRLAQNNPQKFEPDMAALLNNLGILYSLHNRKEAETNFLQSLEIRRRLVRDNPRAYKQAVAQTLFNLANFYRDKADERGREAEKAYLECIQIYREYIFNGEFHYNVKLANALTNLGALYEEMSYYDKMEDLFLEAVELKRNDYDRNSRSKIFTKEYVTALSNLVWAQLMVCHFDEAETTARQCIELPMSDYDNTLSLMYILFLQGKTAEASILFNCLKNKPFPDDTKISEIILSDFQYFRERGLNYMTADTIETLFSR